MRPLSLCVNGSGDNEAQVRLVSTWTAWIHSNDEERLLSEPDDNHVMFVRYVSSDSSDVRARASVRKAERGSVGLHPPLSTSLLVCLVGRYMHTMSTCLEILIN